MTNRVATNDEHTARLSALLAKKIPGSSAELQEALRQLEMLYMPSVEARITAQTELANRRLQYLHPKDAGLTDMDRKIMLDGHTSAAQATYERAAGQEKALAERMDIMKTLLRVW